MSDNCCNLTMSVEDNPRVSLAISGANYYGPYQLPTMSDDTKGGAMLGSGLEIESDVLSIDLTDNATGETITAADASYLASLVVDGKAVQDGTPTPSAPVPVETVSGINLFTKRVATSGNGITLTVDSQGVCTLNGTASSSAWFTLDTVLPADTYTLSANNPVANSGVRVTGEIDGTYPTYSLSAVNTQNTFIASTGITKTSIVVNSGTVLTNFVIKPQLETGSTATPYTPYGSIGLKVGSNITPIDLQGSVLASLPDGTKDVLTVDSVGHVVKQNRVGIVNLGDLTWTKVSGYNEFRAAWTSNPTVPLPKVYAGSTISNLMCNVYQARTTGDTYRGAKNGISAATNFFSVGDDTGYADATAFKNSLTGAVLYYELATPTTTDLGYIDMPAIPDGAAISITAQVTSTITASWWARGAAAIAEALKSLRDGLLARIEAIETAIADL